MAAMPFGVIVAALATALGLIEAFVRVRHHPVGERAVRGVPPSAGADHPGRGPASRLRIKVNGFERAIDAYEGPSHVTRGTF